MAYIREYPPRGGWMGFPSIKSSYAYIWWLGLFRVVQALKVIILPLPLSAGVMCCPPLIFKPSLGRREIYRPVPPPSLSRVAKGFSVTPNAGLKITAGQRTMSGLIVGLTGQTLVWPVILTGHFWMLVA